MLQQKPLKGRFSPLKDFGSIPFSLQNVSSHCKITRIIFPPLISQKGLSCLLKVGLFPLPAELFLCIVNLQSHSCASHLQQTVFILRGNFFSNFTKRTALFAEGGAIPLACRAIPVRGKLVELFLYKSPSANHFHFQGQKLCFAFIGGGAIPPTCRVIPRW